MSAQRLGKMYLVAERLFRDPSVPSKVEERPEGDGNKTIIF